MGSSTVTPAFPGTASVSTVSAARLRFSHRRISPPAGHALEILGHAIEYLTDEFVHAGAALSARDAQVEAVQLLMALNRQIYFSCPEIPTLGDKFRALLHRRGE